MGTPTQPQDTRKRDEESRADKAEMAGQGIAMPPADQPAEQDESGKTAGPQDVTGLPSHKSGDKPVDRTATGKQ